MVFGSLSRVYAWRVNERPRFESARFGTLGHERESDKSVAFFSKIGIMSRERDAPAGAPGGVCGDRGRGASWSERSELTRGEVANRELELAHAVVQADAQGVRQQLRVDLNLSKTKGPLLCAFS